MLSLAIASVPAELPRLAEPLAGAVISPMVAAANMVEVAALVGDTARATILAALMGGQALTASELAYLAGVTRPTASEHLVKLVAARLLAVTRQGRFRYYRIASPLVARMLESIIAVAAIEVPPRYQPRSARDEALRFARTCYDHLAGRLGVAIADALLARGHIVLGEDGGEVTAAGARFLTDFGADLNLKSKRIFCRPCLDWSERRYHIAGLVGAEIFRRAVALGWLKRSRDTRAVRLTASGRAGLLDAFGVELAEYEPSTAAAAKVALRA
jgi:DNA-binding transcriptional ArsR family regulator